MRSAMAHSLGVFMLVAGLLGVGVVAAAPAHAAAYGCTAYGTGYEYKNVKVKNGTFCGSVTGNGTYIKWISGNFYSHIPGNDVCNFSLKAELFDVKGARYSTGTTKTFNRCSLASDLPRMNVNKSGKPGKVKISLISNGSTVAAIEESIL